MTVYYDTADQPIVISPGGNDLRYSSIGNGTLPKPRGSTRMIGRSVSYSDLFSTQPWIGAAVMRMLTWAVRVPLKAYRRSADGEDRTQLQMSEHPLARMLKRPWLGPHSNQAVLIMNLLGPLLVHGNSVTAVETTGGEDYLKTLDWRCLTPIGNEDGTNDLVGWRWVEGDQDEDYSLADTVHCAWWSPKGPLGVSPLEQLGVTTRIEDAAQRYQTAIFQNGARPPSAVTTTTEFLALEEGERKQLLENLREDVNELYAGPENQGRPALLPPGLDWKQVGHSAVEAELIQQRVVAREEIAAVFQIPPPMMGILDHATYSNMDTMKGMAYTMALSPYLQLIEQELTSTIARDRFGEDDVYVEFDYGPVLRGDRPQEIAAFAQAIGTGLNTMNEGRRALNLPPDENPDADRLFYPANNLKPVGDAEAEAEQARQDQADQAQAALELQKQQIDQKVPPKEKPVPPKDGAVRIEDTGEMVGGVPVFRRID